MLWLAELPSLLGTALETCLDHQRYSPKESVAVAWEGG